MDAKTIDGDGTVEAIEASKLDDSNLSSKK